MVACRQLSASRAAAGATGAAGRKTTILPLTAAASIPFKITAAVKMIAADLYEQRGEPVVGRVEIAHGRRVSGS